MRDLILRLEGMSCSHCVNAVNQALAKVPGVEIGSVRIGRAELRYDEAATSAEAIAAAVGEAGYGASCESDAARP